MNYEIVAVDEFQKDVKKLFKKYNSIKNDIFELIDKLEKNYDIGINLGNNLFKIRVRNSNIGGKKGGYRVIYYVLLPNKKIYLLTIYSKTEKENINLKELISIIDRIENSI